MYFSFAKEREGGKTYRTFISLEGSSRKKWGEKRGEGEVCSLSDPPLSLGKMRGRWKKSSHSLHLPVKKGRPFSLGKEDKTFLINKISSRISSSAGREERKGEFKLFRSVRIAPEEREALLPRSVEGGRGRGEDALKMCLATVEGKGGGATPSKTREGGEGLTAF